MIRIIYIEYVFIVQNFYNEPPGEREMVGFAQGERKKF